MKQQATQLRYRVIAFILKIAVYNKVIRPFLGQYVHQKAMTEYGMWQWIEEKKCGVWWCLNGAWLSSSFPNVIYIAELRPTFFFLYIERSSMKTSDFSSIPIFHKFLQLSLSRTSIETSRKIDRQYARLSFTTRDYELVKCLR